MKTNNLKLLQKWILSAGYHLRGSELNIFLAWMADAAEFSASPFRISVRTGLCVRQVRRGLLSLEEKRFLRRDGIKLVETEIGRKNMIVYSLPEDVPYVPGNQIPEVPRPSEEPAVQKPAAVSIDVKELARLAGESSDSRESESARKSAEKEMREIASKALDSDLFTVEDLKKEVVTEIRKKFTHASISWKQDPAITTFMKSISTTSVEAQNLRRLNLKNGDRLVGNGLVEAMPEIRLLGAIDPGRIDFEFYLLHRPTLGKFVMLAKPRDAKDNKSFDVVVDGDPQPDEGRSTADLVSMFTSSVVHDIVDQPAQVVVTHGVRNRTLDYEADQASRDP